MKSAHWLLMGRSRSGRPGSAAGTPFHVPEEALVGCCVALREQPEVIRYHWWPPE
jgi:hypothetical protein